MKNKSFKFLTIAMALLFGASVAYATILPVPQGGTGINSVASGNVLLGNSGTALSSSADLNFTSNVLTLNSRLDMGYTQMTEYGSVSTPLSGLGALYANSDGHPHYVNSAGSDFDLTSAAAAGLNTQIQYNNLGALAGDSNFTWDGKTLGTGSISGINLTPVNSVFAFASGTGLNDATDSGSTYASLDNSVITVELTQVRYKVASPSGFSLFDSITDSTTGAVGFLQNISGSNFIVAYTTFDNVFNGGDTITNGSATTTINTVSDDYIQWSQDDSASASSQIPITAGVPITVGTAGTQQINFASQIGHSGQNTWTFRNTWAKTLEMKNTSGTPSSDAFTIENNGATKIYDSGNTIFNMDPYLGTYSFGAGTSGLKENWLIQEFKNITGAPTNWAFSLADGDGAYFTYGKAAGNLSIGDVPGVATKAYIQLLGGTGNAVFKGNLEAFGSAVQGFLIDWPNGRVKLGDIQNAVNGTTAIVDDGTQTYTLNKLGGGGTQMVTTSNTGVLGTAALPANAYTSNDLLTQTTGVASIATTTTPNDGVNHTYNAGAYAQVLAISGDVLSMQVTYTDENSVVTTLNLFSSGSTSFNLSSTGNYNFPTIPIRCKPNTAVTVKSTLVGAGSISYDVGGELQRIN